MSKYIVSLDRAVDFAPPTAIEEILQNVRTILTTIVGQVPLHRDFGISSEFIDKPLLVARTQMHASIIDAIDEFEPRARVLSVSFDNETEDSMSGILRPVVAIEILEED